MEKVTDWIKLWKELVESQGPFGNHNKRSGQNKDKWKDRAQEFDARVKAKCSKPGPHRDFIISMVTAFKDATVLDIGAGTGAWAIPLSKFAGKVTAIEPSDSMRMILKDNICKEGINNVDVIDGAWPAIDMEVHDFTLSSHSVYSCADLPGFVIAMTRATRRTCFMLLRAPDYDGLMARAAKLIWGQPNDSPNFQVAYNAMLQMGIFPNVQMEGKYTWPGWTSKSLTEALDKIRSRFGVDEGSEKDNLLRTLLKENLKEIDGQIQWPSEVRTGLVYWDTCNESA